MPTKRRVPKPKKNPAPAPAPESSSARDSFPIDLLLEIIACSDVTTIVRCARTCRSLRLAILDPAFRCRLALRSAAVGGGFDPALLLGVSFLREAVHTPIAHRAIHTPCRTKRRVRLDTTSRTVWGHFEPVASRDSLILFRQKRVYVSDDYKLHVCNTFTGKITRLPPYLNVADDVYSHVFLSVGDGRSYELLVVHWNMCFRTFSSKYGKWGDVHEASLPTNCRPSLHASSRPAVVIGRIIYWLWPLKCWDVGILALDVDVETSTMIDLPHGYGSLFTMRYFLKDKNLLASVHGRLSLLVAERLGISLWTLAPTSSPDFTATWSQELVIGREEIEKPLGMANPHLPIVLEGFGERSGTVIVRVAINQLVRLDLGTKVVSRLRNRGNASVRCLFLHEIDLVSILQAMKPFLK
ncbi:unnamed protein product [Alopecurus aequalis]